MLLSSFFVRFAKDGVHREHWVLSPNIPLSDLKMIATNMCIITKKYIRTWVVWDKLIEFGILEFLLQWISADFNFSPVLFMSV